MFSRDKTNTPYWQMLQTSYFSNVKNYWIRSTNGNFSCHEDVYHQERTKGIIINGFTNKDTAFRC